MVYDKKIFEQRIEESPLFSLDKQTEYVAFKKEFYRMLEYLYCYLMATNEKEYEPYGCEITEVATRCINNYDATRGLFLHYFNSAWKKEFSHLIGEKIREEKFHGIRITEEDKRAVQKYLKLADQLGSLLTRNELYKRLSEAMELPIEKIRQIAQLCETTVTNDNYIGDEGKTRSLWDFISDGRSIERDFVEDEAAIDFLTVIEEAFDTLQERQKPIISDMLTIRICSLLPKETIDKLSFINKSILSEWFISGSIPTQRDIAKKYDRNEASISRTINEFLKKLKRGV